jgi:hypothetical protein
MIGMEKLITRTHLRAIQRDQLRANIESSAAVPGILDPSILEQKSAIQNILTIGISATAFAAPVNWFSSFWNLDFNQ